MAKGKCRRIYNVDTVYVMEKMKQYKEETGVKPMQVFNALNVSKSFVTNMKYFGAPAQMLFKLCAIIGINPEDSRLFVGGTPIYEKPEPAEETQIEIKSEDETIQSLREEINALHNEHEVLRRTVARLDAQVRMLR